MAIYQRIEIRNFEPDKLLEAVRGGYTEHFLPRPGECSGEIWRWEHGGVCIDRGLYRFEAIVHGTFRPGFLCLGVADSAAPTTKVNGAPIGLDSIQFYPDGREFLYHAQPGTRWTALQIDRDEMERTAVRLLGRPLAPTEHHVTTLSVPAAAQRELAVLANRALRFDGHDDLEPAEEQGLADALIAGAVECLGLASRDELFHELQIRAHRRLSVVRRAQEMMRSAPAAPYDSAALCWRLSIPERTLQYDFRRTLGTTPKAWHTTMRLYRAHRDLRAASPACETVSAVASRHGFSHLGRFALDYRRLFGESPSQTLRSGGAAGNGSSASGLSRRARGDGGGVGAPN